MTDSDVRGVVLAGGRSRRLGQDKTRVLYSGRSLLARAVDLLQGVCAETAVIGRDPLPYGVAAPWLPDAVEGLGPMGGVITALETFQAPCLVISCDLPYLDEDTLLTLLAARRKKEPHLVMTTFQAMETGYIESLTAVYEPEARPYLKAATAQGLYKLSRAIPPEARHHVPYDVEGAAVFFNVNYPADLAALRRAERIAAGGS